MENQDRCVSNVYQYFPGGWLPLTLNNADLVGERRTTLVAQLQCLLGLIFTSIVTGQVAQGTNLIRLDTTFIETG